MSKSRERRGFRQTVNFPGEADTLRPEWRSGSTPAQAKVLEEEDGVGEVDGEIPVDFPSLQAGRSPATGKEVGEEKDCVREIRVLIVVDIAAQKQSPGIGDRVS